jgi:hypothetical protein
LYVPRLTTDVGAAALVEPDHGVLIGVWRWSVYDRLHLNRDGLQGTTTG